GRVTFRYNLIDGCGTDAADFKQVWEGPNFIHGNVARRTGLKGTDNTVGNNAAGFTLFEGGTETYVYHNYLELIGMEDETTEAPSGGSGHCYRHTIQTLTSATIDDLEIDLDSYWFGNVCRNAKGNAFGAS